MMRYVLFGMLALLQYSASGQYLKLRPRKANALSGSNFAQQISDTSLSVSERELRVQKEIFAGNIPEFYRDLREIRDTATIAGKTCSIRYYVTVDFLAVGSWDDHFYCPLTAAAAQTIAGKLKCSLPTRKISDRIYSLADVKMVPQPIPPSKDMVTVPVFLKHDSLVRRQRAGEFGRYVPGSLVAGNKKDVVISGKIYTPEGSKVVIYGWHQPGGKPIQPLYNGHKKDWVDYSHGIRLVQNRVWVNGKRTTLKKVLASPTLSVLLSDEGRIQKPFYL